MTPTSSPSSGKAPNTEERADRAGGTPYTDSPLDGNRPELRAEVPHAGLTSHGRVRRTRASAWWGGLITAAILAIVFLVFIMQNSQTVIIHLFGFDADLSLAVALLLSAVTGMLLIAAPGVARIIQLRHALKKNAKQAAHR